MHACPDPKNLFKDTAWHYARYRRPYPAQIFEDIVSYFNLNGEGVLLDIGCGTGELTIPLSSYFEKAVGVDASPTMLAEAKRKSTEARTLNIIWSEQKAEDINSSVGPLRLTTAGVSLHWMNQSLLLKNIYDFTESEGGMVVIGDISPVRGKSKTEAWKEKRKELIVKYLGEERRAGDHLHKDFIPEKRPFEELFMESPFKDFEHKEYPYITIRNIDEIIGFLYSTSYASRYLFGDKLEAFENELRDELLKLVPSGKFEEDGKSHVFFLKK